MAATASRRAVPVIGRALRAVPLVLRPGVTVLIDQFLMVMQEMSERFRVRQTASA